MLDNTKEKKKSRLGRGLGSLLGDSVTESPKKEAKPKAPVDQATEKKAKEALVAKAVQNTPNIDDSQRVWSVGIDKVIPNKKQPRKEFEKESLSQLSASIKEQGIIQPITVRKTAEKKYEIIAGERRWRAAQMAGLHEVPVLVKNVDDNKVAEWALIENIQREDLNPIEEAEAYNQLIIEHQYTHQQLADKLGKNRTTISNAMRILTLPKVVREYVRDKKISNGHAKVLSGLKIPQQIKQLADKSVKDGLSVRALEKEVNRVQKGDLDTPRTELEQAHAWQAENLAKEVQKALGTKVKIDYKDGGKGKLTLSFYSDAELAKMVKRLKNPI